MEQYITIDQLRQLGVSEDNSYKYVDSINNTLYKYSIITKARISQFLAQILHESGMLKIVRENLNYSAERMCQVWPSRFHTVEDAQPYAHNPEKLANKVYGGRMGNNEPGDGYKYIGRGFIQITGKEEYRMCSRALNVDFISNPELLEQPDFCCETAGLLWNNHNLNNIADRNDEPAVQRITKIINGGLNGYNQRLAIWRHAQQIL